MTHADRGAELFLQGYNCAQSVAMAFSDMTGIDEKTYARLVSPFGGGMGRMREVCGAVSGMFFVVGQLYGYDAPNPAAQKQCYATVQMLAEKFRAEAGSIICRDILKNPPSDPAPTPRSAEYYKQRPCARMVMLAADILDAYISKHPV